MELSFTLPDSKLLVLQVSLGMLRIGDTVRESSLSSQFPSCKFSPPQSSPPPNVATADVDAHYRPNLLERVYSGNRRRASSGVGYPGLAPFSLSSAVAYLVRTGSPAHVRLTVNLTLYVSILLYG